MTQQALIIGTVRMFFAAAASSFVSRTTHWGEIKREEEQSHMSEKVHQLLEAIKRK